MSEYIERESLFEDLKQYLHCRMDNNEIVKMGFQFVQEMGSIHRIIEKQPPVDVVEVVRCKDCKHYTKEMHIYNEGWCKHNYYTAIDEHFCSYGIRKEGAEV